MKNTKIATLIFAATMTPLTALAETPNWNFLELGYNQVALEGLDEVDPTGFSVAGSKLLGENMFIAGKYRSATDGFMGVDLDINQLSLGIGYRYGISTSTDFYGAVSFEQLELKASGQGISEQADENGHGVTIGMRSRISDNLELDGNIGYIDIDGESETMVGVSAHYYFTPNAAIGVNYTGADDLDIYGASFRFAF